MNSIAVDYTLKKKLGKRVSRSSPDSSSIGVTIFQSNKLWTDREHDGDKNSVEHL